MAEREREGEKEEIVHLLVYILIAHNRQGWTRLKLGAKNSIPRTPAWVAGTQVVKPSLACRVHTGRKLARKLEPGFEPRRSEVAWEDPERYRNHSAKCLSRCLGLNAVVWRQHLAWHSVPLPVILSAVCVKSRAGEVLPGGLLEPKRTAGFPPTGGPCLRFLGSPFPSQEEHPGELGLQKLVCRNCSRGYTFPLSFLSRVFLQCGCHG